MYLFVARSLEFETTKVGNFIKQNLPPIVDTLLLLLLCIFSPNGVSVHGKCLGVRVGSPEY